MILAQHRRAYGKTAGGRGMCSAFSATISAPVVSYDVATASRNASHGGRTVHILCSYFNMFQSQMFVFHLDCSNFFRLSFLEIITTYGDC
jgi:hypothetical protein